MTRDYEKPFILMFRGSLTISEMYAGTIVGFPSNQMSPILPCWISLEKESIHYVSFNKVLRKKSYSEKEIF